MTQETYETTATMKAGKVTFDHPAAVEQALDRFPDGTVLVSVKVLRETRTSAQNRYWHGVVIPRFAEHCGYDFDEMKDALALELIPIEVTDLKTGEVSKAPGHTSDLNTKQFADLIDRAMRLGAEMGLYVPAPNEEAA